MIRRRAMMVLFLLLPAAATAATPPIAMQFAAVLQDPGHRQMVQETARQSPAWTHISCPAASFSPAPEVGVYVPLRFAENGAPVSGEWREGVVASGCGAPVMLNVLTRITAPATLATGFLLPGTTLADPVLQNYAQSFALKAAGGLPAGCRDGYIANTEFTGYDAAAGNTGAWREVWTLRLCGPDRQVAMHFMPDAHGTTLQAALRPAPGTGRE